MKEANDNLPILLRHPRLHSRLAEVEQRKAKEDQSEQEEPDCAEKAADKNSSAKLALVYVVASNKRPNGFVVRQVRPNQTGRALVG